jgi:alginate O-acetyltransferase complex protein AlgI
MAWPIGSTRVAEFWGERWNRAFRDLTHQILFRPLAARLGPGAALAIGFAASGIVHELVISWPAGGAWGLPSLCFALQALAICLERGPRRARLRRAPRWLGRGWTALWVAAPAFRLFHPRFVIAVFLPFLDAIGAAPAP